MKTFNGKQGKIITLYRGDIKLLARGYPTDYLKLEHFHMYWMDERESAFIMFVDDRRRQVKILKNRYDNIWTHKLC